MRGATAWRAHEADSAQPTDTRWHPSFYNRRTYTAHAARRRVARHASREPTNSSDWTHPNHSALVRERRADSRGVYLAALVNKQNKAHAHV